MDVDSLGPAHPAALKAQGPMDSLRSQPPTPGLLGATACLHLNPTVQSHVARHPRTVEPLGQINFRGRR